MTRIYTKTGDRGETGLFKGGRVRKDHPRIMAYGDIDELNSAIGAARGLLKAETEERVERLLKRIQNDLFEVGLALATPTRHPEDRTISPKDVSSLEEAIDHFDRELPPLRSFILPGGSDLAGVFHQARTVCRRAERTIVALAQKEFVDEVILAYVNRLSDLLFVLARWVNLKRGVQETEWEKKP